MGFGVVVPDLVYDDTRSLLTRVHEWRQMLHLSLRRSGGVRSPYDQPAAAVILYHEPKG